jgi:hypothetical protein
MEQEKTDNSLFLKPIVEKVDLAVFVDNGVGAIAILHYMHAADPINVIVGIRYIHRMETLVDNQVTIEV